MWTNYPVAAAFGVTAWGVNAMSYLFGYYPYTNPYYTAPATTQVVYDYSQPLIDTTPPPAASESGEPAPPTPQEAEGLKVFDQAREAFKEKNYEQASSLTDKALAKMPKDAIMHEFRALTLFCLGKYRESAATLYAVLSVTPGMDWTTMNSLFSDLDEYTRHQRTLEKYATDHPQSADAYFLLYYLYKTGGYNDVAIRMIKKVTTLNPQDQLAKQLQAMITPVDENSAGGAPPKAEASTKKYSKDQLAGKWQAKTKTGSIEMNLEKDGTFTWTYKEGAKSQDVRGIFDVDGATLALQPDSGGTMLAEVDLGGKRSLKFKMIGGAENDPGLDFQKQ
jgi:hypothetical protein